VYINKNAGLIILVCAIIIVGLVFSGPLMAQDKPVDRADAQEVANHVIKLIKDGNYEAILEIMDPDRKEEFMPLTEKKRKEIAALFEKDKVKIGTTASVSELRQVTTYSGKDGVAAKIHTNKGEVFVIVLSKGSDYFYYFEDTLNLSEKLYKKLTLLKEIK